MKVTKPITKKIVTERTENKVNTVRMLIPLDSPFFDLFIFKKLPRKPKQTV